MQMKHSLTDPYQFVYSDLPVVSPIEGLHCEALMRFLEPDR